MVQEIFEDEMEPIFSLWLSVDPRQPKKKNDLLPSLSPFLFSFQINTRLIAFLLIIVSA
jgi:hypothetical protein